MSDKDLLTTLTLPDDLKSLDIASLNQLSAEIRGFLIDSVTRTGGHLSSSLGVVELSVALHHVFDSPDDAIVWDVGHQAYPHKILTGRMNAMDSLRQMGGISGFTKRQESIHDAFGAGHSSTSISAALGMALADRVQGNSGTHAIAVIGDGALTGGMAFEALNHAGALDANVLVVLNDNEMSISENVGAMSLYLGRVLSSRPYSAMRELSRKILKKVPFLWRFAQKAEEHLKGMVVPGTLFEELGFNYIGPLDGHDMDILVRALTIMKNQQGPQLLHVITKKGKGYTPAENDPIKYHGVGKNGSGGAKKASYTDVFSNWLMDVAPKYPNMVAITPAMTEGSGLSAFARAYPERFYDVGIAEQHAVTLAAGLATRNIFPVVAIYSTFLQRAYDQVIHDVALQNLPMVFAIDRAGLVGEDGPTHAGVFDVNFLRCIPNLEILLPMCEQEMRLMLDYALTAGKPVAVRYPRGAAFQCALNAPPVERGKSWVLREGADIALLAFGSMTEAAHDVAEQLNATVVNMRFVKPLDVALVCALASQHKLLVTLEEGAVMGGAGSAVQEALNAAGLTCSLLQIGLEDRFTEHGEQRQLQEKYGLDAGGILARIRESGAIP
jgi:1-deoxy-D-xylulose-5-phosphate synthase